MSSQHQILPAVAAAIFNNRGEILLQKRKDANKWCLISGHVEFGETVEEAVIREIFEETNCNSKIVRFIGIYSSPSSQTYLRPNGKVQYVTSYFEAELNSQIDINFSNEETLELKFFNTNEIPENLDQVNSYWLSDALSKSERVFIR